MLHRKLLDHPVFKNPKALQLWLALLLLAQHSESRFEWNGRFQTLKAGQLLTGRKKLSELTGIKPSTIVNILKMLESEQQINQQKTTKYTIITIVNWDKYQNKTTNEQQADNKLTTDCQQSDTYNNVKNEKNEKKKPSVNKLVDYWNSKDSLPTIKAFNKKRIDKLNSRLKEEAFVTGWREAIDKVSASPFCCGQNDRGWRADVSWFLANSDNYVKALEGKYDGEKKETPAEIEAHKQKEHELYLKRMQNA